jgi:hypothetical protein
MRCDAIGYDAIGCDGVRDSNSLQLERAVGSRNDERGSFALLCGYLNARVASGKWEATIMVVGSLRVRRLYL